MSWKEITLYLGLGALALASGALHVVTGDQVGHILASLASFVIGRVLPSPAEEMARAQAAQKVPK